MKLYFLIFLGPLLVVNCESEKPTIEFHQKADLIFHVNDCFEIKLNTNPSTGYRWFWVDRKLNTVIDSVNYCYIPGRPIKTGSGGTAIFKCKARKIGIDSVRFEYRRYMDSTEAVYSKKYIIRVIK